MGFESPCFKVCGMTCKSEIDSLDKRHVRWVGFIFYQPSPRNAFSVPAGDIQNTGKYFETVGVFVDHPLDEIIRLCSEREIKTVQLHGTESPESCDYLRRRGLKIIKAFSIKEDTTVKELKDFLNMYFGKVDMVLFDTGGKKVGGNGMKFNWEVLENIEINIPFLMSGGISSDDVDAIEGFEKSKRHNLVGWDINSKFEFSPGRKDIKKINSFIGKLRLNE